MNKIVKIFFVLMLSSMMVNAHAKEGMLMFLAKKVGASVVRIGEQFAKKEISGKPAPKKAKKVEVDTIPESNVIIVEEK